MQQQSPRGRLGSSPKTLQPRSSPGMGGSGGSANVTRSPMAGSSGSGNSIARALGRAPSGSARGLLPANPRSGSSMRSAPSDDTPAGLFERLTSAVSSEQMAARVAVLKQQIESDGAYAASFGGIIAAQEYAWLAVMQRTFGEFNEGEPGSAQCRHDLVDVLAAVAAREDPKVRSVLVANKLSSILTVAGSTPEQQARAVRAVLACTSAVGDAEQFLQRMQGYENVALFVSSAPLGVAASLVSNLVGKAPATAKGFAEHDVDTKLLRGAFKQLPQLQKEPNAFHRVLYALRFFVRVKANQFTFAERCLSLCAHTAKVLPGPAADLAADVCQVTTDASFTASHPNILANLCAACTYWSPAHTGGTALPRAHLVASFLARVITGHDKPAMAKAAVQCYRACTALVRGNSTQPVDEAELQRQRQLHQTYLPLDEAGSSSSSSSSSGADDVVSVDAKSVTLLSAEILPLVLHAAVCVVRSARPRDVAKFLDYPHLRCCRAALFRLHAGMKPAATGGTSPVRDAAERWLSLIWTLRVHARSCSLAGLLDPVSRFVDVHLLDAAAVQRATGRVYDVTWFADADTAVAKSVRDMRKPANAIVADAKRTRAVSQDAESAARTKFAKHFATELRELLASDRQRYFDAMVLPGCLHIKDTFARAEAQRAASEAAVAALQVKHGCKASPASGSAANDKSSGGRPKEPPATPAPSEAIALRHESGMKMVKGWAAARTGGSAAAEAAVTELAILPILQSIESGVLNRRSTWHTRQQALVCRARTSYAAVRTGVSSLLLLELEEETSRGLGWHGVTYSPAPNRVALEDDDTERRLSLTPIAVQEAEARGRLTERIQSLLLTGAPASETPAASFRVSPRQVAGQSWRLRRAPEFSAENDASLTSIADATLDDWVARFGNAAAGPRGTEQEEATMRATIVADAMRQAALLQVEAHEAQERGAVAAAHEQFLHVAAIALEAPAALRLLLREGPMAP